MSDVATPKGVQDTEAFVPIADGQYLVFESVRANPAGTEYVRFVSGDGEELLYYDAQEWKDDPVGVMGIIVYGIKNGTGE